MTRFQTTVFVSGLALVLALSLSPAAAGAVVLDENFATQTLGSTPAAAVYYDPYGNPGVVPGSFGSNTNISSVIGATDVPSMSTGVIMSNSAAPDQSEDVYNAYTNVLYYSMAAPAANSSRFSITFSQLEAPGGNNTGYNSDFSVIGYTPAGTGQNIAWILGTSHDFPATPNSANPQRPSSAGEIILEEPSDVPGAVLDPVSDLYVLPIGAYTLGEKIHADLVTNYNTDTFNVYLNGAIAVADQPYFDAQPGSQINELWVQQVGSDGGDLSVPPGFEGGSNVVAVGSIKFSVCVPEPGTLALLAASGLAGLAMCIRRRRAGK